MNLCREIETFCSTASERELKDRLKMEEACHDACGDWESRAWVTEIKGTLKERAEVRSTLGRWRVQSRRDREARYA